jgi:hypothetical protein
MKLISFSWTLSSQNVTSIRSTVEIIMLLIGSFPKIRFERTVINKKKCTVIVK